MSDNVSLSGLENHVNQYALKWLDAIQTGNHYHAGNICIKGISTIRDGHSYEDSEDIYHASIFLRLLLDASNLYIVAAESNWYKYSKAVEYVWNCLCDAKERCVFFKEDNKVIKVVHTAIDVISKKITEVYGNGMYQSAEYDIDQIVCSICNQDVRICTHKNGAWYDGKICSRHAKGITLTAVALVENPRNPRCRIWPWQWDEDKSSFRSIVATTSLDYQGNEANLETVKIKKIFPQIVNKYYDKDLNNHYDIVSYKKLKKIEIVRQIEQYHSEEAICKTRDHRINLINFH